MDWLIAHSENEESKQPEPNQTASQQPGVTETTEASTSEGFAATAKSIKCDEYEKNLFSREKELF